MKTIKNAHPTREKSISDLQAPDDLVDKPINILIVDDEPKNLMVLETILDDPGYRLVRAETADQALLALMAEEFALLILDIRMPGMTGLELAQMIRARKKTALVPIIFLTAYYNEDQHVLDGYAAGAVDYLQKPVNRTVLRSKVEVFAELHRGNRILVAEAAARRHAEEKLRQMNDTLEQRVIEQTNAVRATEAQLRSMIDALPVAVYATDAEGFLTHYNRATVELAGREPKLGVDRWCATWKLFRSDGTPLPHEECPMAVALKEGRISHGEQIIVERPDGERIWVTPYPTPLRDESGNIIGGITMLVDITDAQRAESELSAAKQAAEKANAAKSDFLANMSHEIRTPMNAIFGFTQLLSESIQSPLEREWIISIKKSGQMLLNVINDVLDLSKIEAGKLKLHTHSTDISNIVDDTIVMFTPQAVEKGIKLTRDIDLVEVEPLMLDGQRLRQVLTNLVSNAVKYTERGSVDVKLLVAPGKDPSLRDISFIVTDTGVGIPPEQVKQIFEPFQQAESPDGKVRQGTGLGLNISLKLINAMQGCIDVESELGRGTTFTVKIPNVRATEMHPAMSPVEEKVDFNLLPPLVILAVDDVLWNVQVAVGYLRNSHHTVHTASDGAQGVARAKVLLPDVVLMDLRMPSMNGYEARVAMRAEPSLARTAILAVTASSLVEEEVALRHSFDGYIRKPYSPTQLFNALKCIVVNLSRTESLSDGQRVPAEAKNSKPALWRAEFREQWQQLQKIDLPAVQASMRMREIDEFATRLHDLAVQSQFSELEIQAEALQSSTRCFDVRKIDQILHHLSQLPADYEDA